MLSLPWKAHFHVFWNFRVSKALKHWKFWQTYNNFVYTYIKMLMHQKNFAIFYKSQDGFYKKLLRNTFDTVANDHTVCYLEVYKLTSCSHIYLPVYYYILYFYILYYYILYHCILYKYNIQYKYYVIYKYHILYYNMIYNYII